jgi:hypothetical protein
MIPVLAMVLQIIKRANQNGETVTSLSSRFINEFLADVAELQCLPPNEEPRVTDHIEHIIELITEVFLISLLLFRITSNATNSAVLLFHVSVTYYCHDILFQLLVAL